MNRDNVAVAEKNVAQAPGIEKDSPNYVLKQEWIILNVNYYGNYVEAHFENKEDAEAYLSLKNQQLDNNQQINNLLKKSNIERVPEAW